MAALGVGEAEKRGGVAGELAPKAKAEDAVHNNPGGGKCGPGGGRGSLGIQHRHLGRQLGKGGFGQGRGRRALDQNNLAGRAPLDQLAGAGKAIAAVVALAAEDGHRPGLQRPPAGLGLLGQSLSGVLHHLGEGKAAGLGGRFQGLDLGLAKKIHREGLLKDL